MLVLASEIFWPTIEHLDITDGGKRNQLTIQWVGYNTPNYAKRGVMRPKVIHSSLFLPCLALIV